MATVAELHETLLELAGFMEEHGLPYLDEVRRSADEVGRGDAHGARRLIDWSRALADVWFHPANGNAANEAEAEELNRRFSELTDRALTLSRELLRTGPDARGG